RLWESYMAKHFDLPPDHLHDAAERVEHFLDPSMRSQLAEEVPSATDPHGRAIPAEPPPRGESPPANEANADRTRRKQ
ncbi:MAG: iron dependent repressor, metal binding and dimerization domain protein, partial [Pirellulaceae bacterium]|nr:iron dependent repressor, metal binding and dimerization domain protein [Pirellulaceae bacterium]